MHPEHQDRRFIVPRRDDSPDVGEQAAPYREPLADEIKEAAGCFLGKLIDKTADLRVLVAFGVEVLGVVQRRAAADVEDFPRPASAASQAELSTKEKACVVAAELGRILDWICKGQLVLDMGVRAAVVASHIRAGAIDHRTDQELAREIGNDSRASVNKTKADFRRSLGADYAGENGKSSNTKARCKNSRNKQLRS